MLIETNMCKILALKYLHVKKKKIFNGTRYKQLGDIKVFS